MEKLRRNRPFMFLLCISLVGLLIYLYSCSGSKSEQKGPSPKKTLEPFYSKASIAEKYSNLLDQLAAIRKLHVSGTVMEKDSQAFSLISHAQTSIREYVAMKYGAKEHFYVAIRLAFPRSMVGKASSSEEGLGGDSDGDGLGVANATLIIETAPMTLAPYSAFYFLEMVEHFQRGAFHRSAGHVLQAYAELDRGKKGTPKPKGDEENEDANKEEVSDHKAQEKQHGRESKKNLHASSENIFTHATPLAWQEYSPDYPHKQWTLGYAGRPGGPSFYISIEDNTNNHGPGSQGSKTEADTCFGRVVRGKEVVRRMKKQPGAKDANGFVSDEKHNIKILDLNLITVLD
jgi:cyclophilin family peptidyl-prolyl cis-trans isomerase